MAGNVKPGVVDIGLLPLDLLHCLSDPSQEVAKGFELCKDQPSVNIVARMNLFQLRKICLQRKERGCSDRYNDPIVWGFT